MENALIGKLSAEYILGLIADRKVKAEELAVLDKTIEAAMLFAPPGFDPAKPPSAKPLTASVVAQSIPPTPEPMSPIAASPRKTSQKKLPDDNPSWPSAIMIILAGSGRGMSHKEVVAVARQRYEMPPQRGREEKAFYNALNKLTMAGKVVKHGNLLYAASVYKDVEREGALPPVASSARRAGSSPELVVRLLRANPDGMTGPQMREAFTNMPHAPKSLSGHAHYVYNVLAPMIGRGEVVRNDDGVYRLSGGAP